MDSPQYYIGHNGTQLGPFPKERVSEMLAAGELAPGDLCWFAGASGWLPLSSVFASTPPPLPENVPFSGNAFSALYPTSQREVKYAGFWRRFAAYLIDLFVLHFFGYIISLVLASIFVQVGGRDQLSVQLVASMIALLTSWLYFSIFESSSAQATPGKHTIGIIVTDYKGNRISFWRATGRFFGRTPSTLTLFFGYFICGWTQKKQTLHDMIAGCLVRVK
jgi:uncharacterized RDD family membrane protein YckC